MRLLRPVSAALLLAVSLPCFGSNSASLTILLDFENDYSQQSISEMKRETQHILGDSGVRLEWRLRKDVSPADSFPNFVVVKFKGRCVMEPIPFLYDERGPLAITHSTDGVVLPFSEVACDKIRSTVSSALWGGERKNGEVLFGRALGRVVAHEVYHVLGNTRNHSHKGVAKTGLSGLQLIGDELGFDAEAAEAVRSRH